MTKHTQNTHRTRARWLALFIAAAALFVFTPVFAGMPVQVPVQGLLTDSEGAPIDGATDVTFRIYADASSTDALWESEVSLAVDRGLFDANLGAEAELDSDIFAAHPQAHLTITIAGDEESPRLRLGVVPTAAHALSAATAEDAHTLQGQTPEDLMGSLQGAQVGFDDTQTNLGADNTQAALEALLQRVEALEQDRQALQNQVDAADSAVAALDSRVATVETDTSAMQSQITAAQSAAQANASDIATLQTDVGANTSDLASLQSSVSANTSDISSVQASVSANTSDISSVQASVSANTSDISSVQSSVSANAGAISTLESKTASMSATTINGRDAVAFDGVNLYVRNGTGSTSGTVNGTGNLIVGYGESSSTDDTSGSHNLIVGRQHSYSSYGGIVAGNNNSITGNEASVFGGSGNIASGITATVMGGFSNEASGRRSAVISGWGNIASGSYSAILAGYGNETTMSYSAVGSGQYLTNSSMYKFQAEGSIAP